MPTYVYWGCEQDEDETRVVPIAERDNQRCEICGLPLKRKIAFTGLTWAPTAGGYR